MDVAPALDSLAPDYPEAVVAWRTWALSGSGEDTRLRSVVKPTLWEPGDPLRADCLRPRLVRRFRRHTAPSAHCVCGIYAAELAVAASYLGEGYLRGDSRHVRHVIGRVALWGSVVECDRGFRATYAYPQHIYVAGVSSSGARRRDTYAVAAALESYRVPVTIVELDEPGLLRALGTSGNGHRMP